MRKIGEAGLRTRAELKNMNSFRFVARGIDAEIKRQIGVWESGGEVVQETYDYDPETDSLTLHRTKEEAEDYRYLPEPDLVPVEPEGGLVERLRSELPELPSARLRRLAGELDFYTAHVLVTGGLDRLYEAVGGDRRAVANVLMNQFAAAGAWTRSPAADPKSGKAIAPRLRVVLVLRPRPRNLCRNRSRGRRTWKNLKSQISNLKSMSTGSPANRLLTSIP